MLSSVDITFDFRTEAGGKDPDAASPTLRRYHKLLWSKPLPCGEVFDLSESDRGMLLHHYSELGEFVLSSDAVITTLAGRPAMNAIADQLTEADNEAFKAIGCTVGGRMVFPAKQIDRQWTINQARGMNRSIADRFDLTLECIRRHYTGETSPLTPVLERYADFFALFTDFRGYVDFFLLADLVTSAYDVEFFLPFDDFVSPSVPSDLRTYEQFRSRSIEFAEARNRLIDASS